LSSKTCFGQELFDGLKAEWTLLPPPEWIQDELQLHLEWVLFNFTNRVMLDAYDSSLTPTVVLSIHLAYLYYYVFFVWNKFNMGFFSFHQQALSTMLEHLMTHDIPPMHRYSFQALHQKL